jgi:ankyrin repeat protein
MLKLLLLRQQEDVAAAINAENFFRYTPIHLAVLRSNVTIAKILLQNGAKINAKSFSWAATIGHTEMLGLILHGCTNMETAIMMRAASGGSVASLELILEVASRANRQAELSSQGLPWAAQRGYESMCKIFLRMGPDINARTHNTGESALEMAAMSCHTSTVAFLLDSGADPKTLGPDFQVTDVGNKQLAEHIVRFIQSKRGC